MMAASNKPKFEQQESLVLDAAIKCIEESSLLDFTMAAIAKEANLSMGSVYKNIQSKEDVLVALATRMMANQRDIFTEIMALPLTTPERMVCSVLMSPQKLNIYSFGVHLDMLISNEAVLQRASSRWLEKLMHIDQSIEALFHQVLMQSCLDGELQLPEEDREHALEMIAIGIWSISVGFTQVAYQRQARRQVEVSTPLPYPLEKDHALILSVQHLLNIHPWQTPLDDKGIEKAFALLKIRGLN